MIYGNNKGEESKSSKENEIEYPNSNVIIQSNNLYNYSLNNPANFFDSSGYYVYGIGWGFSIGLGPVSSLSLIGVIDDNGNEGLLLVGGFGGGFGYTKGNCIVRFPSADTIYNLEGAGAEVSIVGFALSLDGKNNDGLTLSPGAELRFSVTYSKIIKNNKKT